jgi:hypothetical protein
MILPFLAYGIGLTVLTAEIIVVLLLLLYHYLVAEDSAVILP